MAIPLYIPREIGPQSRTSAQHRNSNNTTSVNNSVASSQVLSEPLPQNISFLAQLIMELFHVYERYNGESLRLNENPQSQQPAQELQDNQNPAIANNNNNNGAMEDSSVPTNPAHGPLLAASSNHNPSTLITGQLPDLIQCSVNATASVECSITTSTNTHEDDFHLCEEDDERYSSQNNLDQPDDDGWGLDLGIKLQIGAYRRCGQELRQIADSFQSQNQSARRNARSRSRTTGFKFEMKAAIKLAVPAIAIAGLGWYFQKK